MKTRIKTVALVVAALTVYFALTVCLAYTMAWACFTIKNFID